MLSTTEQCLRSSPPNLSLPTCICIGWLEQAARPGGRLSITASPEENQDPLELWACTHPRGGGLLEHQELDLLPDEAQTAWIMLRNPPDWGTESYCKWRKFPPLSIPISLLCSWHPPQKCISLWSYCPTVWFLPFPNLTSFIQYSQVNRISLMYLKMQN